MYLALHQSYVKTELVELTTEVPLFGGLKRQVTRVVPQPVLDEDGRAIKVWKFVIPHFASLIAVITVIHVMDAYRVFEPILVFGASVFANSVQYLTYYTLSYEDNANNDFIISSQLMNGDMTTMTAALGNYMGQKQSVTRLMHGIAGAVSVTIPIIILVYAFQKHIVAGLTAGATKG